MPEGVGYGPQSTGSVGKTLNYIGEHVYAYSGGMPASTTSAVALNFTTGNHYLTGIFQVNQALQYAAANVTAVNMQITLNGEVVVLMIVGYIGADSATVATQELLIPPNSTIEVSLRFDADQSAQLSCVTYSGRVHGKID